MRKLVCALLALTLAACMPVYGEEEMFIIGEDGTVQFDGLFSLTLPEGWAKYETEEETAVKFGDGSMFMTVMHEEFGEATDLETYRTALEADGVTPSAYIEAFGGTEFVLYVLPEEAVSVCAVMIPDNGIYSFRFGPIVGDIELGETIITIMDSFVFAEAAE